MEMIPQARSDSQEESAWSKSRAWGTLLFLTLCNVIMSLDRTIPQMIAEPVKEEFRLSDGQVGIFIGLAFGLSYGISGLLVGPLIDRFDRKKFLATILSIWSAMTFFAGMATSYTILLITRSAVGGAEAGGNPAALSIIGDVFPVERRSTAIGLYKVGVPVGIFLASSVVVYVAADFGWRAAFFVGGLPGLILAALMFFWMREPRRGAMDDDSVGDYEAAPYGEALKFVLYNRSVSPFAVGMLLSVFSGAALMSFAASFLQRNHDLSLKEVGLYFAIGSALSWFSPIIIGILGDRVVRGGQNRIFFFLTGLVIASTTAAVSMIVGGDRLFVIGCFLLWQFLILGQTTPSMAALITLTPRGMRGTVISLISVGNMCVGFGLGPLVVGFLSDLIGGAESLRAALLIVVSTSSLTAAALFALTGIQLRGGARARN